jgi:hypothetical protein
MHYEFMDSRRPDTTAGAILDYQEAQLKEVDKRIAPS